MKDIILFSEPVIGMLKSGIDAESIGEILFIPVAILLLPVSLFMDLIIGLPMNVLMNIRIK